MRWYTNKTVLQKDGTFPHSFDIGYGYIEQYILKFDRKFCKPIKWCV